ncbi:MAG: DNA mismatch repair endonuclease MutL [Roseburia sp.]
MPEIALLSQETIDKIAAGEVIERPSSVVKELVENAIDAKATAITVEIKEGGISFIRITDNGCGMKRSQVPVAFLRHSTSKIKSVEDLMCVNSLGFRGEALSSIAAVAQVELITKTLEELTGTRYVIEGSKEKENEEIGAPDGTTFIVRNLFFNTPARRKFLKTAQTEAGYISDLVERLALSHPGISFKFINNGQTKLHTSGNSNQKDLIYHIYGRDIAAALLPVRIETEFYQVEGFIGKPLVSRGNRNFENYFINGRYIKSSIIARAIEEAYKGFMMQHQYPFCVLHFTMESEKLDVNVHPTKMELRFENNELLYKSLYENIRNILSHKDFIPEVSVEKEEEQKKQIPEPAKHVPEPFETRRLNDIRKKISVDSPYERKYPERQPVTQFERTVPKPVVVAEASSYEKKQEERNPVVTPKSQQDVEEAATSAQPTKEEPVFEQQNLESISTDFLTEDARKKHKIIGQLFDTYWLVEYEDKLFIIDQHAAHEKVLYEKTMAKVRDKQFDSQTISPPIILSLSPQEIEMLEKYKDTFILFGYQIEHFGGKEYAVSGVPSDFTDINTKAMFLEMLDDFTTLSGKDGPNLIMEKVASMSCKAAVKGNQHLSYAEMDHLIGELLGLENPYHCPHGRPTIISMSKYEIEKKFKRIV